MNLTNGDYFFRFLVFRFLLAVTPFRAFLTLVAAFFCERMAAESRFLAVFVPNLGILAPQL